MYRDDQEALLHRADSAAREAERLRQENLAMRRVVAGQSELPPPPPLLAAGAVYAMNVRCLPLAERARLAQHAVQPFPVWLAGLLHFLTLGLFSMIHFSRVHGRLPRASQNDPSTEKAIGFTFIPYFNFYWIFFNPLRLCDRLTLQLRLRGLRFTAPKGLVLAACIATVVPYLGLFIGLPILWTIAVCFLQKTVNDVAALSPDVWDAAPPPGHPGHPAPFAAAAVGAGSLTAPFEAAALARASRLVIWSNLLGWGGLAVLVGGSIAAGLAFGPLAAGMVGGLAGLCVVTGAVLGQVGRGMQNRII